MKPSSVFTITRKVTFFECLAIGCVIGIIWSDELFDIPFLLLGAEPSPVNWQEATLESAIVLIIGALIISFNRRILSKLNRIATIIPTCPSCRKAYDNDEFWEMMRQTADTFRHEHFIDGVCMDCIRTYSPEAYEQYLKKKKQQAKKEQQERSSLL